MARSIISTMGASKIRRQLRAIMTFVLPLPDGLNEELYLNITNEALLDELLVSDPESNTSTLSSDTSTYGGEEVELILGYIDKDAVIHAA